MAVASGGLLLGGVKISTDIALTNIDLENYAKKLKIPHFKGVYMRDEVKYLKKDRGNECGIINPVHIGFVG